MTSFPPREQNTLLLRWSLFWLILSVVVMIFSIYFNWSHWGNLALVNDDVHREFVTPIRLLQGEVLYKDFNFLYGTLPPYVNSWIIQIPFFDAFTQLRFTALTLFLLNLLFLWLICRDIGLSWIFGPVLFGITSWTASYTFNPSSFNAIYATLFATFGTWCAIRTLKGKKWVWFGLGIACAGAILSKPEGFFVLGLALVGAYIFNYRKQKSFFNSNTLRWLGGFFLLSVSFIIFLFLKGLSWQDLAEGILQSRFQKNLSAGFIEQYNYFFGINHVIVITAGVVFIALIFYLIKLYQEKQRFLFFSIFSVSILTVFILAYLGQLWRITDDYQNLGEFFGGILGYWWYRQLPDGTSKNGLFIFWLSSLGGWLRPLFHIGALVIPFRVGGGMLLAAILWFLILPFLYQRIYSNLVKDFEWVKNIFIKLGCIGVLIFGFTGLYFSWNTQWKHPNVKYETKYGSLLANRDLRNTQLAMMTIEWLKKNLGPGDRVVALSGMPVELILGWLPRIPISACINYQIYSGDTERITKSLREDKDVKFVLVHIDNSGYHFGIQDYKLADYLDEKWHHVFRVGIPNTLTKLVLFSPERKKDFGLNDGFIVFGKN